MHDRFALVPRRLKLAAVLTLMALLGACKDDAKLQEEVRPVRVMTAGADAQLPGAELNGTVRAHVETPLGFRIGGKLIERRVEIGAVVKKGQVIARIDPQDAALNATAADAQAALARAQLAKVKMDYERSKALLAQKFVSQAEVDTRKASFDAATESLKQAEAQRQLANNQAAYATLLADADGAITKVSAEPGQVVAAGTPIVTLARDGVPEVALDVPENLHGKVKLGDKVLIRLWAMQGREFKGHVSEISAAADPASRTYAARVVFDEVVPQLGLGMTASVRLAAPDAVMPSGQIRLPLTALFGETGKQQVWRLDAKANRVHALPVKVLTITDTAVLVSGVKPGEIIVTAGVHLLREGQPVTRLAATKESGA
ncbi:resistance-nodulation-cell division (RND) efflux membrane fusion protein [Jeongeupia sp. HS-3]|uniref:efflux RND transporter periplasmic adaptor subunit n=1 Tax=Jeongeupia sp. HS-3 TaxID=1009682 RepID=UPI0018A6579E|nr:efflux RND transporter periplasmic adaptor subunit [Jeongeupia sp. HS-3]BCL76433.1 resistance-nodulation-cell division (RND) efflux membrane fusion protein [Jeongeupia sp. HS-3]